MSKNQDKISKQYFYSEGYKRALQEVLSYGYETKIKMPWVAKRYKKQLLEEHYTHQWHTT